MQADRLKIHIKISVSAFVSRRARPSSGLSEKIQNTFFSGTPCISYFRKRFSQPSRLGKQRQHLVNSYLFLYGCRRFCDELVPTFHICCQVPFFWGTRLHFIQNASPTYVQYFVTIIQHQCLCKQNIFTKLTTLCKHSLYRPPYLVAITEHNLCDPP